MPMVTTGNGKTSMPSNGNLMTGNGVNTIANGRPIVATTSGVKNTLGCGMTGISGIMTMMVQVVSASILISTCKAI